MCKCVDERMCEYANVWMCGCAPSPGLLTSDTSILRMCECVDVRMWDVRHRLVSRPAILTLLGEGIRN